MMYNIVMTKMRVVMACGLLALLCVGCVERATVSEISAELGLTNIGSILGNVNYVSGFDSNGTLVTASIERDVVWFKRSHYYNGIVNVTTSNKPDKHGIYWGQNYGKNCTWIEANFKVEMAGTGTVMKKYNILSTLENADRTEVIGVDSNGV
jgi:hypothetical protein